MTQIGDDEKKILADELIKLIDQVLDPGPLVATLRLDYVRLQSQSEDGDPLTIDVYGDHNDEQMLSISLTEMVKEMIDDRCSDDRYNEPVLPFVLIRDALRDLATVIDEHLEDRQIRVGELEKLQRDNTID
jgi:Arc/MetJ-type ribon-helix-helix transcriptional regulator